MSDKFQIVFKKAGDGSPTAKKTVAEKIASASKTPVDKLLEQIEAAPFIYKRGLPRAKADAISATLNKLGGITEVTPDGTNVGAEDFEMESGSGEFGFGTPAPAAPAASGGFDFGGGSSSGGFDFGGGGGGLSVGGFASPSPAASGPSGAGDSGFSFSADAAVSTPNQPVTMVDNGGGVERNLDYASDSGAEVEKAAKKKTARGNQGPMVTCKRCGTEVPEANECASCGVVMAKAGAQPEAGPARRPSRKPQKKSISPITIGLGLVAAAALALVAAFLSGALNPMRLSFDAKKNPVLHEFGATLAPPIDKIATVAVTKPGDIEPGFIGRYRSINTEIQRLAGLDDFAAFQAGKTAVEAEIAAYASHPANQLLSEARRLIAPYYPVEGIGLKLGDRTYMFAAAAEAAGRSQDPDVEIIKPAEQLGPELDLAGAAVKEANDRRLGGDYAAKVNVSYVDHFDAAPANDRWTEPADKQVQFNQGWLYLVAQAGPPEAAPRLLTGEPLKDYTMQVVVSGQSKGARAGLIVMQNERNHVILARASGGRGSQVIQIFANGNEGTDSKAPDTVTLRIERKGSDYTFLWQADGGAWNRLDAFRPFDEPIGAPPPRFIGIVAYNGTDGFYIDDFDLQVTP